MKGRWFHFLCPACGWRCPECRKPRSVPLIRGKCVVNPEELKTPDKQLKDWIVKDWIDAAAEGIRSQWMQWESEAGQISQNEQDSRAGEEFLAQKIADYLRWSLSKDIVWEFCDENFSEADQGEK